MPICLIARCGSVQCVPWRERPSLWTLLGQRQWEHQDTDLMTYIWSGVNQHRDGQVDHETHSVHICVTFSYTMRHGLEKGQSYPWTLEDKWYLTAKTAAIKYHSRDPVMTLVRWSYLVSDSIDIRGSRSDVNVKQNNSLRKYSCV